MTKSSAHTNHLIHETSPYLRQHAHNPVDWYPWGEEALQKARQLDRPIFLSIGYSACHWCHVMEHESFEDPEIGKILNDHYISIKVDREERPDLDQIYMAAVQILTQSGGWPMSVFLTPDLKPFYGGTYFPPDNRYGRPSFRQVLHAVQDAWTNRREAVLDQAKELTGHIRLFGELEKSDNDLNEDILKQTIFQLSRVFDQAHGGFGMAPKFPHAMELRLLLRVANRLEDETALSMVRKTLDGMALGGMYDHLGGGFHRYSTDQRWLVPHFEKMLYDNALLPPAYLEAYQVTGEPFYREVVEETLDYVIREMTSPEGAYYSTQDADSEGEEGKFFVWSKVEIDQVLGDEDLARLFCSVYDVTSGGNWEEKNILHRSRYLAEEAALQKMEVGQLRARLNSAKKKLFEARGNRIWPGRDEKVLTSWNGLMLNAFAQAGQVLGNAGYIASASRAADFLLSKMRTPDGKLLRTWFQNSEPKLNAYLEDYSFLIDGLITLFEATFELRWLKAALELTGIMIEQFWDEEDGGFFYTGKDHEQLIARGKDPHDSSIPSGNSVAVTALLRLAKFTGNKDLFAKAEQTLHLYSGLLTRSPQAGGQMLMALDYYLGPVDEFAIATGNDGNLSEALGIIRQPFHPRKIVAVAKENDNPEVVKTIPLLEGKSAISNQVTTYICRDFTCQAPIVGVEALREVMGK